MTGTKTSVLLFGAGPIGCRIARVVARRGRALELVAAVDNDPAKIGRALSELDEALAPSNLTVQGDCPVAPGPGSVAVHATTSDLGKACGQVLGLVTRGWNVVSTCEELVYPSGRTGADVEELHAAACEHEVSVLAAGINPGFIMDVLPLALTAMCERVDAVRIVRVLDTDKRREPLQQKAGVGMSVPEFVQLASEERIGHVGLRQCVDLLADRLGWTLQSVDVSLDPVVAERDLTTGLGNVEKGRVIGQRQVAIGRSGAKTVISLELEMSAGATSTDEVWIDGDPNLHQVIEGGVNGDIGTAAVIANLIVPVAQAAPGLMTMSAMMPVGCNAPHPAEAGVR